DDDDRAGGAVVAAEGALIPPGLRVFADAVAAARTQVVDRLAAGVAGGRNRGYGETGAGAGEGEGAIASDGVLDDLPLSLLCVRDRAGRGLTSENGDCARAPVIAAERALIP